MTSSYSFPQKINCLLIMSKEKNETKKLAYFMTLKVIKFAINIHVIKLLYT